MQLKYALSSNKHLASDDAGREAPNLPLEPGHGPCRWNQAISRRGSFVPNPLPLTSNHLAGDDAGREAPKLAVLVEEPGHLARAGVHVGRGDVLMRPDDILDRLQPISERLSGLACSQAPMGQGSRPGGLPWTSQHRLEFTTTI